MTRVQCTNDPFIDLSRKHWGERGDWQAHWVDHPRRSLADPSVALFRRTFTVAESATVRLHVSADNRYRLYLDGQPVGRGPERGDPLHWRFESYEITLTPGAHTLLAFTWWLADSAPFAQMSIRPGFLLAAEGTWQEVLSTGIAPWEASLVDGYEFAVSGLTWGTGAKVRIHGDRYPWGCELGEIGDWQPVTPIIQGMSAMYKNEIPPYWLLTPATLPPMKEDLRTVGRLRNLVEGDASTYPVREADHLTCDAPAWAALLAGDGDVLIPPHTRRRAIIDLENYYCAYPEIEVSGGRGARMRLYWAEALFVEESRHGDGPMDFHWAGKGNRDEVEGKFFLGAGDEFLPDGGDHRLFTTLWWEAGRYVELVIETADTQLTLHGIRLRETGYPLGMEGDFHSADPRLEAVIPIAQRVLQMCAHETYMDCPYYEQLMYIGDTRLEVLATYALMRDDRLPRKAITSFNDSRRLSGLTTSRFPCRMTQIIPPFSLWWTCMVYDHWRWRDDPAFIRTQMPGVRGVLEYFRTLLDDQGIMGAPNGWNFTDWVKEPRWIWGIPRGAEFQPSSILNLQFALALLHKAEIETSLGETALAARDRATAIEVVTAVLSLFWNEERGLIADDQRATRFSEHAQCLALLTGLLPEAYQQRVSAGLLNDPALARTTIYFNHYLFETYYLLGCGDRILDRLGLWFGLEAEGFTTTPEEPEPARSDCHAWGAHPLYHYYASLLGIRPDGPGFRHVRIAPQLGALPWAEGTLPHPAGMIRASVRINAEGMQAQVTLPEGITGVFAWQGQEQSLAAGGNTLFLPVLAAV